MALTSVGYDGSVNESDIAKAAPFFGPPVVEGGADYKVTVAVGQDRTVAVAPGAADACFVRVVNDATTNAPQSGVVASGKRWDTVVLRRNWTTNTSSFVTVAGTSTATIASGVNDTPGTTHDQLLALVEITSGVQAPTQVVSLRRFGPGGRYADSLLAAGANPPLGTELIVNGVSYLRVLDSSLSPVWQSMPHADTGWLPLTVASGWSAYTDGNGRARTPRYRRVGGVVYVRGAVRYGLAGPVDPARRITSLPAGFRPGQPMSVPAGWTGAYTQVTAYGTELTGGIFCDAFGSMSSAIVLLDGLTFPADQ